MRTAKHNPYSCKTLTVPDTHSALGWPQDSSPGLFEWQSYAFLLPMGWH